MNKRIIKKLQQAIDRIEAIVTAETDVRLSPKEIESVSRLYRGIESFRFRISMLDDVLQAAEESHRPAAKKKPRRPRFPRR